MIFRFSQQLYSPFLLLLLASWLPLTAYASADDSIAEKRIGVCMRMIGHEVLQCLGNENSRVLPIEKIAEQEDFTTYRIPFEFQFEFDPSDIIIIINQVMASSNIASDYLVQVEQCETKEIVHSFEIRNAYPDLIPCTGRILPKDCYSLLITLFESYHPLPHSTSTDSLSTDGSLTLTSSPTAHPLRFTLFLVPVLILLGFTGYFMKRSSPTDLDPNILSIGKYQWDKRNMTLSLHDQVTSLSHKEAALLTVLHANANRPMEREALLQQVWGDEGDYIGRTLDVFISKLRKKLEADSTVKIINIRGVGYKLMLE